MKLIELNPRWCLGCEYMNALGVICRISNNPNHGRYGMGLTFDCPIHRVHRLGIMFENPLDGKPPDRNQKCLWNRVGETFDALSLSPSIDASVNFLDCWHGFIQAGEIIG